MRLASPSDPLVQDIVYRIAEIFCWVPSHVGIRGNEEADKVAKEALSLPFYPSKLPYTDFKPAVFRYISETWQSFWDTQVDNKLHSVKPLLGESGCNRISQRKETILARLRIGHTRLTHSYLLERDSAPECAACQSPLTVKHILMDCGDFALIRQRSYCVSDLRELFESVPLERVFGFLREVGLFHRL